ncbi:hypothetical protein V6N11_015263 [Hibiscus sabdariffa]|uniref:Uncharacterized protein n=1 Tax=Hibiscus sabdariffa TaxID=183260 RepID=A0ABR2TRW1_9ROSI
MIFKGQEICVASTKAACFLLNGAFEHMYQRLIVIGMEVIKYTGGTYDNLSLDVFLGAAYLCFVEFRVKTLTNYCSSSRRKTWRLDKAGSISMDVKTKPERFYDAGDGSFMVNSHVYTNKASL